MRKPSNFDQFRLYYSDSGLSVLGWLEKSVFPEDPEEYASVRFKVGSLSEAIKYVRSLDLEPVPNRKISRCTLPDLAASIIGFERGTSAFEIHLQRV